MQGDQQNFLQNRELSLADQVGSGYSPDPPISSFFGQNVDFQPSQDCPRNFIIFDRTDNHSQIMYNPATASNFGLQKDVDDPRVMKEDSADIDALLSIEDKDKDEELSTARTKGNEASDTSESCSSRPRNSRLGLSSSHKSKDSERKHHKMRKMVESIKGIVPGGNRMNTVCDYI